MSEMRVEFEAWASKVPELREKPKYRSSYLHDRYQSEEMQTAWQAWQAACNSQQPRTPRKQFLCTRCGTTFDAVGEEEIKEAFKAASEHDKRCQGRPSDSQNAGDYHEEWQEGFKAPQPAVGGPVGESDTTKLFELMRGLEIPPGAAFQGAHFLHSTGKAIAAKAKKAAPQPQPDWVPCSERLPTEADADPYNRLIGWDAEHSESVLCYRHEVLERRYITHWKPTGLTRPQPPEDV